MNIIDIAQFYASPLGKATGRIVAAALNAGAAGQKAVVRLGIGYPLPWLDAKNDIVFMLAKHGVIPWPPQSMSPRSVLIEAENLPLADNSIDEIVIAHGLEFCDEPEALIEEAWRVLAPLGTLKLLVPNRRGLWAAVDSTPFGHGQPFSKAQLVKLLGDAQFSLQSIQPVLHGLPAQNLADFKLPEIFERVGQALPVHLAGAWLVAAQKQVPSYAKAKRIKQVQVIFRPFLLPSPIKT